jgi:hypothetical protein
VEKNKDNTEAEIKSKSPTKEVKSPTKEAKVEENNEEEVVEPASSNN